MRGKLLLAVVILSSSFVWGQTNATAPGQKPGRIPGTTTVKTGQSVRVRSTELTGLELSKQGELTKCRRDCELALGGVRVKADEVDYHSETGEAEARGNVRIKELPDTTAAAQPSH